MTIPARYSGACPECGERWQPGDLIRTVERASNLAEVAERDALSAQVERVRALAEHYSGLTNVDAGGAILRALDEEADR